MYLERGGYIATCCTDLALGSIFDQCLAVQGFHDMRGCMTRTAMLDNSSILDCINDQSFTCDQINSVPGIPYSWRVTGRSSCKTKNLDLDWWVRAQRETQ